MAKVKVAPKAKPLFFATLDLYVQLYVPLNATSMEEAVTAAKAISVSDLWSGKTKTEDIWDSDISVQSVNGPSLSLKISE